VRTRTSARTPSRGRECGLPRYVRANLLCIDEIGYLSYDARHVDLLFEVVPRRYEKNRSLLLSPNKPFAE